MKRILLRSLLAFLLIVVIGGLFFNKQLIQLYRTIHLFDEDVIVWNFSHLDQVADSVTVKKSGPVREFGRRSASLADQFEFRGRQVQLQQWLQESSTTALLVVQGNDIVFEQYYQETSEEDARISWSVAKSFLSAVFGIAVDQGKIPDLTTAVTEYVPALKGSGYDGVSIKDVLQMSSGVHFNEDYADFNSDINRMGRILALGGSFDEFAASLQRGREPGTEMHYVSIDTHVLGMVLRAATGVEYANWFGQVLWSQLGAEQDARFIVDSEEQPMVLGGLMLTTRDYARFGQLYRDHGRWGSNQIVSKQWVEDSITPDASRLEPSVKNDEGAKFGYGYQWWLPPGADEEFMAIGIYGQYIYVDRKTDVVIVKNSADRKFMENNFAHDYMAAAAFRAISRSF